MDMRSIKVDKNTKDMMSALTTMGFQYIWKKYSYIQKEGNMQWRTRKNVYVREGLKPKDRELEPHITLEIRGQEDKEKNKKIKHLKWKQVLQCGN